MTVDDIEKVKREISAEMDRRGVRRPVGLMSVDTIILVSDDFRDSVEIHIIQKNGLIDVTCIMTSGCLCFPVPWLSGEDFDIRTRFSIHDLKFSDI